MSSRHRTAGRSPAWSPAEFRHLLAFVGDEEARDIGMSRSGRLSRIHDREAARHLGRRDRRSREVPMLRSPIVRRRYLCVATLILSLVSPAYAFAQQDAEPLRRVFGDLKPGDPISIIDTGERRTRGTLQALTASTLSLLTHGEPRTFEAAHIAKISVRDPILNGALIGLGIGAVPGIVLGRFVGTYCENEAGRGCERAPIVVTALFAAVGAGIGAGIDGLFEQVVYDSSRRTPAVTLLPTVATGRQALTVSVAW